MRVAALVAVTLGAIVLAVAGCGGTGDPDREELERLRSESEFAVMDNEREALITGALALASRNAGKPLGDDAFALAEGRFLDWYLSADDGIFADRSPEPAREVARADEYLAPFRSLAGFIELVPAPYRAPATLEELEDQLTERAGFYLFRLDEAVANRTLWVSELQSAGRTALSFTGQDGEFAWGERLGSMRYLRDLASGAGLSGDFLAGWDSLVAAVTIADYAPPTLRTEVRDGKIVTTYTAEAVAAGSKNVTELTGAIAVARKHFPGTK